MNLEVNYQLNKIRLEKQEELKKDLEILKKIPYKDMSDLGWIKETTDKTERVFICWEFFGVASLSSIKPVYNVAYRKHKQIKEVSDLGILAWVRKAELKGISVKVEKFNKRKLKSLIPTFRQLTMKDPEDFYPEVKRLCAECGIALVLVPALPKTYICGATIWRNNKAILALSVRGKRADIFWFTFFHEVAHLINHSPKEFHICYENKEGEDKADSIASNYLIPEDQYRNFIKDYDYKNKVQIEKYSCEIGIAPYILVGRLQHDNLIEYQYYADLIPHFQIIIS